MDGSNDMNNANTMEGLEDEEMQAAALKTAAMKIKPPTHSTLHCGMHHLLCSTPSIRFKNGEEIPTMNSLRWDSSTLRM